MEQWNKFDEIIRQTNIYPHLDGEEKMVSFIKLIGILGNVLLVRGGFLVISLLVKVHSFNIEKCS